MEVERRKKKKVPRREVEVDEGQRDRLKKLKGKEGPVDAAASADTPTEEEVDELYAILRRMKEAVNYFDRKGKEWRHALEQAEVTLDDAENVDVDHNREPAVKIARARR
ncbi:hypothetical protein SESBI_03352 [Sesbania bispinosa]|nr:hypothetical protein SESBI_03352 [Sesbania bispinosa]